MRKRAMPGTPDPRIRHVIAQMACESQREIPPGGLCPCPIPGPAALSCCWRKSMAMAVAELPVSLSAPAQAGAGVPRAVRQVQLYFAGMFIVSLGAFVLGVEGRFPGGLFIYPPSVDWIPPLSGDRWLAAFVIHQQDPIYAACGGAQSLDEFVTLYWWEWGRRAGRSEEHTTELHSRLKLAGRLRLETKNS